MQIVLYDLFVEANITANSGENGVRWYGCALGESKWLKGDTQMEGVPKIPNMNEFKAAAPTGKPNI